MPENQNIVKLHENLVKDGYDLPDLTQFVADMQDPAKLGKLHSNLVGDGYDLPDLKTFSVDIGFGTRAQNPTIVAEKTSNLPLSDREILSTSGNMGDWSNINLQNMIQPKVERTTQKQAEQARVNLENYGKDLSVWDYLKGAFNYITGLSPSTGTLSPAPGVEEAAATPIAKLVTGKSITERVGTVEKGQYAKAAAKGVAEFADMLTTPENAMLMGTLKKIPELHAPANVIFKAAMFKGGVDASNKVIEGIQSGNYEDAITNAVLAVGQGAMLTAKGKKETAEAFYKDTVAEILDDLESLLNEKPKLITDQVLIDEAVQGNLQSLKRLRTPEQKGKYDEALLKKQEKLFDEVVGQWRKDEYKVPALLGGKESSTTEQLMQSPIGAELLKRKLAIESGIALEKRGKQIDQTNQPKTPYTEVKKLEPAIQFSNVEPPGLEYPPEAKAQLRQKIAESLMRGKEPKKSYTEPPAIIQAIEDTAKGLNELFGGQRAGIQAFSEYNYKQAKPLFDKAWEECKKAGKDYAEFSKRFIDRFGKDIVPYLRQYESEQQAPAPSVQAVQPELSQTLSPPEVKTTPVEKVPVPRTVSGIQVGNYKSAQEVNKDVNSLKNSIFRRNKVIADKKQLERGAKMTGLSADEYRNMLIQANESAKAKAEEVSKIKDTPEYKKSAEQWDYATSIARATSELNNESWKDLNYRHRQNRIGMIQKMINGDQQWEEKYKIAKKSVDDDVLGTWKDAPEIDTDIFNEKLQFIQDNVTPDVWDTLIKSLENTRDKYYGNYKKPEYFLDKLIQPANLFTRDFGIAGAKMVTKAIDSGLEFERLTLEYKTMLEKAKETLGEYNPYIEESTGRNNPLKNIVNALQDRQNADKYLISEGEKKAFDFFAILDDTYSGYLQNFGFQVMENHYPQIRKTKVLEEFMDGDMILNNDNYLTFRDALPKNVTSPYTKPRIGFDEYVEDPFKAYDIYCRSMARMFAYQPFFDYYYGDFKVDVPKTVKANTSEYNNAKNRLKGYIRDWFNPETVYGDKSRSFMSLQQTIAQNLLMFNITGSLNNMVQRTMPKYFISDEAYKLSKQFSVKDIRDGFPKDDVPMLKELLSNAAREKNFMLELPDYAASQTKVKTFYDKLKSWDWWTKGERGNWDATHMAGALHEIIKSKEYKDAISSGKSVLEASESSLQNPDIYKNALYKSKALARDTQYLATAAARPTIYSKPYSRVLLFFTRYNISTMENIARSFKLEGINGLRALEMLKDAAIHPDKLEPVESLRVVSEFRKRLEFIEEGIKNKTISEKYVGYSKSQLAGIKKLVLEFENGINDDIKRMTPELPENKVKATRNWMSYYGKMMAFSWLSNTLLTTVYDTFTPMTPQDKQKTVLERALDRSMFNVLPTFWIISSPMLPSNVRPWEPKRQIATQTIKYFERFIPGVGIFDRLLNYQVSKGLAKLLFPSKGKETKWNASPFQNSSSGLPSSPLP